ncbi:MAG TPA: ribosome maturation factor, partial [Ruminococcaceae bacterium]|nr:ribosome maturation factor [Oscillospiraceae bacterium]
DKDGGVNIDDCERVSRKLDKLLDEADPIDTSYCLEVSSPGIERELLKKEHFEQFLGQEVWVRFIRAVDGERDFYGVLTSYDNGTVTIRPTEDTEITFETNETSFVRVVDHYEYGGQTENE